MWNKCAECTESARHSGRFWWQRTTMTRHFDGLGWKKWEEKNDKWGGRGSFQNELKRGIPVKMKISRIIWFFALTPLTIDPFFQHCTRRAGMPIGPCPGSFRTTRPSPEGPATPHRVPRLLRLPRPATDSREAELGPYALSARFPPSPPTHPTVRNLCSFAPSPRFPFCSWFISSSQTTSSPDKLVLSCCWQLDYFQMIMIRIQYLFGKSESVTSGTSQSTDSKN